MELNFLVSSSDKMVDDMGRGSIATGTTEPLAATKTLDNAAGRMDAAVSSPNVSLASK